MTGQRQSTIFFSPQQSNKEDGYLGQVPFPRQTNLNHGKQMDIGGRQRIETTQIFHIHMLLPQQQQLFLLWRFKIRGMSWLLLHNRQCLSGQPGTIFRNIASISSFQSFAVGGHLKFIQFEGGGQQYIFLSSMSRHSNTPKRNSKAPQNLSDDCESSSSNFSLSKTRKIQRKTNKKKITKMVHTYCFIQTGRDGQPHPLYFQQVNESALRDPQSVRNFALRQLNEQSLRIIQNAKKSTGFTEKEPSETMLKVEPELALPAYQSFQPAQFYYIF